MIRIGNCVIFAHSKRVVDLERDLTLLSRALESERAAHEEQVENLVLRSNAQALKIEELTTSLHWSRSIQYQNERTILSLAERGMLVSEQLDRVLAAFPTPAMLDEYFEARVEKDKQRRRVHRARVALDRAEFELAECDADLAHQEALITEPRLSVDGLPEPKPAANSNAPRQPIRIIPITRAKGANGHAPWPVGSNAPLDA